MFAVELKKFLQGETNPLGKKESKNIAKSARIQNWHQVRTGIRTLLLWVTLPSRDFKHIFMVSDPKASSFFGGTVFVWSGILLIRKISIAGFVDVGVGLYLGESGFMGWGRGMWLGAAGIMMIYSMSQLAIHLNLFIFLPSLRIPCRPILGVQRRPSR